MVSETECVVEMRQKGSVLKKRRRAFKTEK